MKTQQWQAALLTLSACTIAMLLYWQVDAVRRGGSVMVLIIMCSIFAMSIVLERAYYFVSLGSAMSGFNHRLKQAVLKRAWPQAMALARQTRGPIARVVVVGLAAREETPEAIEQVMEEAARDEQPEVELHVRWLSTLAQVSTLLGLLGTVIGMVAAFQVIQSKATATASVNPADLAGGIWQALTTTVAGLEVAIPTILAYSYFQSRIADVQFQMEKAARLIAGWRLHTTE